MISFIDHGSMDNGSFMPLAANDFSLGPGWGKRDLSESKKSSKFTNEAGVWKGAAGLGDSNQA